MNKYIVIVTVSDRIERESKASMVSPNSSWSQLLEYR